MQMYVHVIILLQDGPYYGGYLLKKKILNFLFQEKAHQFSPK